MVVKPIGKPEGRYNPCRFFSGSGNNCMRGYTARLPVQEEKTGSEMLQVVL
jgi:hypothetical protein